MLTTNYGFFFNRKNSSPVLTPLALLADVVALPLLMAGDAMKFTYDYALCPMGKVVKATFGVVPESLKEFALKSLVFTVPSTILAGMAYVAYSALSGKSMIADGKMVFDGLCSAVSPVIKDKTTLAAITLSFCLGSAITSYTSKSLGDNHSK